MSLKRKIKTLVFLLLTAITLSACGGSSSSDNSLDLDGDEPVGDAIETGLSQGQEINSLGTTRNYNIYVPQEYAGAPVVFLFHGFGDSADGILGLNGKASPYEIWLDIAERENIILVVPNGLDTGTEKGWNDCRSDATGNSTQDDVAFIRELIGAVANRYSADQSKVYVTGSSNGGHFSIRLGLEMPELITAFGAVIAANSANSKCTESVTPVSALFMNGTADPLLPYDGGQMTGDRGLVFSATESVSDWVQRNGTDTSPVVRSFPDIASTDDGSSSVTKRSFVSGDRGTEVVLYTVSGGGHNEPSIAIEKENSAGTQNRDIEMAEEVWSFFKDKTQ